MTRYRDLGAIWDAFPEFSFTADGETTGLKAKLDDALRRLTRGYPPQELMHRLQGAGVPCGAMQRGPELLDDPHLRDRGAFTELFQPGIGSIPVEAGPCRSAQLGGPPLRPAPLFAEHTYEVCRQWLGMADDEIKGYIDAGALEVTG